MTEAKLATLAGPVASEFVKAALDQWLLVRIIERTQRRDQVRALGSAGERALIASAVRVLDRGTGLLLTHSMSI